MILLDLLFYYLTYWFEQNKDKLSWSTPMQRTAYAIGLMMMGILYSANECFSFLHLNIPALVFVIGGLALMKLNEYIYITKERYKLIAGRIPQKFGITDDTGAVICLIVLVLSVLSPFIVTTILTPFGSNSHER